MSKYHYFDASKAEEINMAVSVAQGEQVATPSGLPPFILSRAKYLRQPAINHPHPWDYPCFNVCDKETSE